MTKNNSIFIKNIYYMLSYAFTTLNQSNYEDLAKENFENIHNLFASILSKGIGQQLKQGLYREYIYQKEDIIALRGKIDMQGTIKNKLAKKQVLSCEYDELLENNLLNKILKTTVITLLFSSKVTSDKKSELKKMMLFFSNIDTIDITSIKWKSIRFSKNNQTYRMLITLCQLIFDGMLLTTEKGEYKLASFLDKQQMNRLYEKFILEYYTKEFPSLTVNASQIPWALDDGINTLLPVMQSDITLSDKKKVLIIDAKYYTQTMLKKYDKEKLRSGHLYQIFTYVKNAEFDKKNKSKEVAGMLLYAKTDEDIQPNNDYQMSGNKIIVKTLDLNQDFLNIRLQLNDIVKNYFNVEKI